MAQELSNIRQEIANVRQANVGMELERNQMEREINEIRFDEVERKKCKVCFNENQGNFALLPCGHFGFCEFCIEMFNHSCPICRSNFYSHQRINAS